MVPSYPTILIGYGHYGRSVLKRLLQEAHDCGALVWEEPDQSEGPGARRLKDLALIGVGGDLHLPAEKTGELVRDLHNQIEEVPSSAGVRSSGRSPLAEAVVSAKDRLLDASRRAGDRDRLRLGLDVIIFAQPVGAQVLGNLEDLLQPAMDALAGDRSLAPPAQGEDLLNFLLFLDFDQYWAAAGKGMRGELRASVERWYGRRDPGQAVFSRIFLMDGQIQIEGRRPETTRIEELVLLLRFMLFEGQRNEPSIRLLFQRERDDTPPLATFGIRCLERANELLTRLAAARFAYGWLDYLAGSSARSDDNRESIRKDLAQYRPANLTLDDERRRLLDLAHTGLEPTEAAIRELTSKRASEPEWPARVRSSAAAGALEVKRQLSAWAGARSARIAKDHLTGLPERLREIIDKAISGSRPIVPLGLVIEELRNLQRELQADNLDQPPGPASSRTDDLEKVHRRYLQFCNRLAKVSEFRWWWALLACLVSAAWTPILLEALRDITPPDPSMPFLFRTILEALAWLAKPWLIAFLLLVFAAAWGYGWFKRQIDQWVERSKLDYTHPDRGMLQNAARKELDKGGTGVAVRCHAENLHKALQRRVRLDVRREVTRVLDRIEERKSEVIWLRAQMREFLRTHGIDPDSNLPGIDFERANQPSYRVTIEQQRDLDEMLASNPTNIDRFLSMQSEMTPLKDWSKRYCDTFLYPVVFLEGLRKAFDIPASQQSTSGNAESARATRANDIIDFLERLGQFRLAFDWGTLGGSVMDVRGYCILPTIWRDLPNVRGAISGQAFVHSHIIEGKSPDRCYLLRFECGASTERICDDVDQLAGLRGTS